MAKLLTKNADTWKFIFLVDWELVGETVENKGVQELDYWHQVNWCPRGYMQKHRCSGQEKKLPMPSCILQFDFVKCVPGLSKKQQLFQLECEGKNTGMGGGKHRDGTGMFFPVVLCLAE